MNRLGSLCVMTLLLGTTLACGGKGANQGSSDDSAAADVDREIGSELASDGQAVDTTPTLDSTDRSDGFLDASHDVQDASLVDVPLPDQMPNDGTPDDSVDNPDSSIPDQNSDAGDTDATDLSEVSDNPWPVPVLDEEPSPICAQAAANQWYFQFLDNLCDEKVLPTVQDRDRKCPVSDNSPFMTLQDGTVVEYKPSSQPIEWDTTSIAGLLPSGMRMVVILIKRVNGVPYYRYLSNGTHETPQQPWSTTKILAAANAAATVRSQSDYMVGLTAMAGEYWIGDLITSLVNYDESPFTSNGLGKWFHNVGGRQKANQLIHELWLDRPVAETFGGNYGEQAPSVPYTWTEPGGAVVTITPDSTAGYANNLSLFTLAEAVKRLVLHREEASQRLPGIQWLDLRVLLFGAEESAKYGKWGGMSADTAIYLQAGHDISYIEARSQGQWSIFSKLGMGTDGQFIHVGYACWPVLDSQANPVEGWGREFIIAAHLDEGGATWTDRDRILARAYRKVILRIADGRL